ncbi:PPOX class F420-dependent oxidoreductase [Halobacteriales archaeon QS_9_68_42]|nr:MAG: PPOX class F420-dependent oxidoreductase [Halobacteriales archaeon QS_9_68_42]
MASIPEEFHDLFEKRTFAHLLTLAPHSTPVWADYDEGADQVPVNTARGRRKERNVRANSKVGVSMCDPDDPYRYVSVQGEVATLTEDGAVEHIDALVRRYTGLEEYPNHGEGSGPRVILEIRPNNVVTDEQ